MMRSSFFLRPAIGPSKKLRLPQYLLQERENAPIRDLSWPSIVSEPRRTLSFSKALSMNVQNHREVTGRIIRETSVREARHVMVEPPKPVSLAAPKLSEGVPVIWVWSDLVKTIVPIQEIWLRDHCQCDICVHPVTKQRMLDTFMIPKDIKMQSASEGPYGFHVTWSDGHESYYSADWLAKSALQDKSTIRQGLTQLRLWRSNIRDGPPVVQYKDVMASDDGVRDWLALIRIFGFCYVEGCPPTPEATKELLERIAFIRNTHYGGFWDFTSNLASKDTAYTDLALGAHTDNTYFSDPAGLQMFHLLSHTEGEGGASLLVDGFAAAQTLQEHHREDYDMLSDVDIYSHASGNEGISIQPYRSFPVLDHDPQSGGLVQVRWNPSDRAAINIPLNMASQWYDAARKWEALLRDPECQYWEQLRPGRPLSIAFARILDHVLTNLVFDNWRILHGRSAFTGKRRLCGGYINRDDFISRYKMTNLGQDEVLRSIATA